MNTSLLFASAVALSLVSSPALAQGAGADGPQYPNLMQVKTSDAGALQIKAEPVQEASTIKATPSGVLGADGFVYAPTRAMGAGRERSEVRTETIKANHAGEFGHAVTPY